jgi:hypothetical protein
MYRESCWNIQEDFWLKEKEVKPIGICLWMVTGNSRKYIMDTADFIPGIDSTPHAAQHQLNRAAPMKRPAFPTCGKTDNQTCRRWSRHLTRQIKLLVTSGVVFGLVVEFVAKPS